MQKPSYNFLIEKRWVIMSGVEFIGVGGVDGGYPHVTDLWRCKKFKTLAEAYDYAKKDWSSCGFIGTWKIYEITDIDMRPVHTTDMYEVELAALKKKYGRD